MTSERAIPNLHSIYSNKQNTVRGMLGAYAHSRFTANATHEHLRCILRGACGKFTIHCEEQELSAKHFYRRPR